MAQSYAETRRMGTRILAIIFFGQGERLAFGGVVAIPLGNLNYVVAGPGNDGLAAEARVQLLIGGHIQAIKLIVVGFADAVCGP